MLVVVPASVAEVDAADEGHRLVDHHDLLVVRPEEHARLRVVWVTENLRCNNRGDDLTTNFITYQYKRYKIWNWLVY
jgi:hypothetical protein